MTLTQSTKKQYLLFFVLFIGSLFASHAQEVAPFTPRLDGGNIEIRGDIIFVGNNILNRATQSDPGQANTPYNGTANNNSLWMEYIDIDSDATTFSSSSAELNIADPACSQVRYAGLYWAATYPNERSTDGNASFSGTPRIEDWFNIKFQVPGGSYVDLTADTAVDTAGQEDDIIYDGYNYTNINNSFKDSPYICYKNVTDLVRGNTNPNGAYTVANVRATKGRRNGSSSAGWVMVIIYENPNESGKFISTFDGYAGMSGAVGNVDVAVNGFRTLPTPFPVRARIGVGALEGDRGINNDQFRIKANSTSGGFTQLSTGQNPGNNFFNSTITTNGNQVPTRTPYGTNTLGTDLDLFNLNNPSNSVLPNGESGATLRFTSSGDGYGAFLTSFAVEIIEPNIVLEKRVEDIAGNDITDGGVNLGQTLDYVLSFRNLGNDNAENYNIRDVLPTNTTFVSFDVSGAPGVTANYDASTNEIDFAVPDNRVEIGDPVYTIRLRVQVASNCFDFVDACSDQIENLAYSTYRGEINSATITDDPSVSDFDNCGFVTPGATNFLLDDLSDCNFTRTVQLCGANAILDAGDGFDSYEWYLDENGNNQIDAGVDTPLNDGDPDNDPSTLLVDDIGTYIVDKIIPDPCKGFMEIITVERFGSTQTNPIIDYFNNVNGDADPTNDIQGEIVQCSVDGDLLPKIFLCGTNDSQPIQINITDAQSLAWEKLDESSCSAAPDDCANKNLGCSWGQVASGNNYTADTAGKYRLVINYTNGCFSRFYFDVFQNNLDILFSTRDIICTRDGRIQITNLGINYGYQLVDHANSSVLVPFTAGQGPTFDFSSGENGSYRVEVVQLDGAGNPIPGACIFSTDPIGIRDRDFQVDIATTPANCNAQGSIKIDVLNVRPDYTYILRQSDGTLIDDETAQSDNTHTFTVNPGDYIVETSTADGCFNSQNITVGRIPDPTLSALTTMDIGCSAGTIELTRTGGQGNPDFLYAIWSKDGTDLYPNIASIPPEAYQVNSTFSFGWRDDDGDGTEEYIPGEDGTYEFIIIDANNCYAFSNPVTINDNGTAAIDSITETQPSCSGDNDGALTINVSGGITPYQYSIDDGATYQSTPNFVNLSAGTYMVRVLDGSGCDLQQNHILSEPAPLTSESVLTQDYTCNQSGQITVGSITPTAGGSGSYQYSIDGGTWTAPTPGGTLFTNLTDGTYSVRVRDANAISCRITLPAITIDPLPVTPTPTHSVVYNCDGSGNITVFPNDATYTYSLDGGTPQASNIFNNITAGSHTITIDYGSDCTIDVPVVVQSGQAFAANVTGSTNLSCNGLNDGSITFEVSNFDSPTGFEYSLDGGTSYINSTVSPVTTSANLSPGTQTVLVRKATDPSCSVSLTRNISEPSAVIASASITAPYSCTNSGATITASAADGVAPYEYRLEDTSGGIIRSYQGGTTFTNVTDGNYIVRARDNNGCDDVIDAAINVTAPAALSFTVSPTLCYSGANDATIGVNVSGGNGGLLFSINGNPFESPDAATPNSYVFDNLGSGSYTINVQDQRGCTTSAQTVSIAPAVTVTASAAPIPECTNTTEVTINAAGGDTNFVYALVANGATPAAGDFNTTNTRTVSAVGDYDVYVRDNNGNTGYCEAGYDLTVTKDDPLTVSVSSTPVQCSGSSQSTLTIAANGGGVPYRYSIDDGTTYQTSDTFSNLPAGSYDIRVQDVNNCEVAQIHVINEPFTLSASALVAELIECNPTAGAEVRIVNARGGTAPYEYSFDGGANYQASNISNLFPGDHTVFVRDANNCSLPLDLTVLPPQVPPGVTTDLEYFCDGDATITVTPDDPLYDYTYELDNVLNTPAESNVFTDVPAGNHVVTVNYVITTVIPPSTLLTEDFGFGSDTPITEIDPVYCYEPQNGSPSCPGFGTDTHIQDGEYTVTQAIVNPYGTWIIPNDHTSNTDGRYLAINVGGVAGFGGIVYAKRNIEVLPNQDISISLWAINLLRQGTSGGDPSFDIQLVDPSGNIIASTTTGDVPKNTGPDDWRNYSVDLNPGANPTLDIVIRTNSTVTGGNDIAIDDLLATQPPAKCPAEVSVDVIVEAGKALEANITATSEVSCNGASDGTITFEVNNFDAANGFEYSIDGGTTFIGPETTSPLTINGLAAGTVNIEVRDVLDPSCTVMLSQSVTQPNALETSAGITSPYTCDMPSATITASALGGTPTYEYQLENTGGTIIVSYQTSTTFTNVAVGDYIVRGRDANGCADPIDAPIAIVAPSNPTFAALPTSCYSGNNDATIQVDVLSGNSNYQFSINGGPWLTPSPSTALTYTFQNLPPGTYAINVKDQFGCIGSPQNSTVNPQLTASAVVNPDLTCSAPASITITANGGSGSYSYEWSDDSGLNYAATNFTGNVFNTTNDGTYIFRVTDTNACTVTTAPVTVTPADTPVITSVTPTHILCNGDLTGSLDVTIDISVGRPVYTIEVLETNTTTNYGTQTSGLPGGDYEVRITDDKGCVSLPYNVSIIQPDAIAYDINLVPITCNPSSGTDPGSITVENLTGGTAEYTYFLTGNNGYSDSYATTSGGEDHTFAILEFGIYEVDVVDANGCSLRSTNIIASPPNDLDIDVTTTTVDCTTGGTAVVTVSSAVGSGNYEFATLETYASTYSTSYQPADTAGGATATFTGLTPGVTYTFVVHDFTTDCYYFETAATPVNSPSSMTANLDAVANVTCKGAADGNVSFTFDNYDSSATDVAYEIFNAQSNVTTGFSGSATVNPPAPSTGVSVSNFAALAPGVYYILFSEVGGPFNGCSIGSPDFTISESSVQLIVTATSPKNDNCNTDAGRINAQAQYGTAPYEFQYLLNTAPAPTAASAGWVTDSFANVEAGDYIVYVKDAYGCIQTDTLTVGLDPSPEISVSIMDECVDEGTFEALVTLDAAGVTPYLLSLNGGAFQTITFDASNEYTISGLSSGINQTIALRDLNGCGETETFTIHPPLQYTAIQSVMLDCEPGAAANAEITIEVTSGSGGYELEIDGPGSADFARAAFPSNPYVWTGASTAGSYEIRVYDINTNTPNCSKIVTIDVPNATVPDFTETHTNVTCNGSADGTITLQEINNGVNPLTYTLTPMPSGAILNGNTFENLPAGTYDVQARGNNDCPADIVGIIVSEPAAISVPAPTVVEFGCTSGNNPNNASIEITGVSGGSGNFVRYEFINDDNPATLASGDPITVQNGSNATYIETDVRGGSYTVNVYDDNGCMGTQTATIAPYDELLTANTAITNDISCNPGNDGEITVSVTSTNNDPSKFEYSIDNGATYQTSNVFPNLGIGTHVFLIRHVDTGCLITASQRIDDPNTFTIAIDKISDVVCFGTATGEVTLELVDATYSGGFDWEIFNTNGTPANLADDTSVTSGTEATNGPTAGINLAVGSYYVTVAQTNAPTCTNTEAFTISGPVAAITGDTRITEVTCVLNDGSIEVIDVLGGWGGYTYFVDLASNATPTDATGFQSNPLFTNLSGGVTGTDYQVWIADANGCLEQLPNVNLIDPSPISADLQVNVEQCTHFAGEIEVVNVMGGQGSNYRYQLQLFNTATSNFENFRAVQTSAVFSGLGAGRYQVVVSDQWGCSNPTTAPVELYPEIVPTTTVVKTIDCTVDPGGQITVSQTGGSTGTFTYTVTFPDGSTPQPSNTSGVFMGLTQVGEYTFTITDDRSCSKTIRRSLQPQVDPVPSIDSVTDVTCFGDANGTIAVSVLDNGVGPYTFQIIDRDGTSVTINPTSSTNTTAEFTALANTTTLTGYTIAVTGTNGCVDTVTQTMAQPAAAVNVPAPAPVSFGCSTGNVTDYPTIEVTGVTGGSGTYVRYEFINDDNPATAATGDAITVQDGSSSSYTETDLAGGTYTINVYDSNGCMSSTATTIDPFVGISDPVVMVNNSVTCSTFDEDITVSVTVNPATASPNLEYVVFGTNVSYNQTNSTGMFTGLGVGNYTVSITNLDTGCTINTVHSVADPDVIEAVATKLTDEQCLNDGVDDGSFGVAINNYTGNYSFQVYDINDNPIAGPAYIGTGNTGVALAPFSNLPEGVYYVRITETEAPFCEDDSNPITILAPDAPITATIREEPSAFSVTCSNDQGKLLVNPEGGEGPYTIVVDNTTTSQVHTETNVEAFIFSGLSAGSFHITVTDAYGCVFSDTIDLIRPDDIIASIASTPLTCFDGNTASVTASVNTRNVVPVYRYRLNRYGDLAGSNLLQTSAAQASDTFNGLAAGFYSIRVTDDVSCSNETAIIEIINPTEVRAALIRTSPLTCTTGVEFELSAIGGSGNYEYSTDNTSWTAMIGNSVNLPLTGMLSAGTYQYYVRDAINNCTSVLSNSIEEDVIEPLTLTVDQSAAVINCNGDNTAVIHAAAEGGLGNYEYSLYTNASLDPTSLLQGPKDIGEFSSLPMGTYYVEVTSGNDTSRDCTAPAQEVIITEPDPLSLVNPNDFTNVSCNGANDGSITVELTGGVGPYQYAISPNLDQFDDQNTFEDLAPGAYRAIAQDRNGCFIEMEYTITQPDVMELTVTALPEVCEGEENGSIELTITGGTAPYSTRLSSETSFVQDRTVLNDLASGSYIVFIRDAMGCEENVSISVDPGVNLDATVEPVYGCDGNIPTNYINIVLGDDSISDEVLYALDSTDPADMQLNPFFRDIAPGPHYISISHANGCIVTHSFNIENYEPLTITVEQSNINEITANVSGGKQDYTLYFGDKNNGSDNTFMVNRTDTYVVTVVDENGCEASANIFIEFIDIEIPNFFSPNGDVENQYWKPRNDEGFPQILTIIFDRYGREVYRMGVNDRGWDGLYRQTELPTGDYWYVIRLNGENDEREFVGHFTLYR